MIAIALQWCCTPTVVGTGKFLYVTRQGSSKNIVILKSSDALPVYGNWLSIQRVQTDDLFSGSDDTQSIRKKPKPNSFLKTISKVCVPED